MNDYQGFSTPIAMPDNVYSYIALNEPGFLQREIRCIKAPVEIWNALIVELKKPKNRRSINGCGSKSTWWVPENLFGLCITLVCHIHDLMYNQSETPMMCKQANHTFRDNIFEYVEVNSNIVMRFIRKHLGLTYYDFVFEGKRAFCRGFKIGSNRS